MATLLITTCGMAYWATFVLAPTFRPSASSKAIPSVNSFDLIMGMLMALAMAIEQNGTRRPYSEGSFCKERIYIQKNFTGIFSISKTIFSGKFYSAQTLQPNFLTTGRKNFTSTIFRLVNYF